jgi:hypothetical protein
MGNSNSVEAPKANIVAQKISTPTPAPTAKPSSSSNETIISTPSDRSQLAIIKSQKVNKEV